MREEEESEGGLTKLRRKHQQLTMAAINRTRDSAGVPTALLNAIHEYTPGAIEYHRSKWLQLPVLI
jgi:hypothetical protein